MSPKALEKLQAAAKFVGDEMQKGTPFEQIILAMISLYGASRSVSGGSYTLNCCGVRGSCTWSRDAGLLKSWNGNATTRLMRERLA